MSELSNEDTIQERTGLSRFRFWILVEANRWIVTGGLTIVVFVAFMLFGVLKPIPLNEAMKTGNMVQRLFASLIGAIITGTSLVVTINQLLLPQQIGSLGKQREEMDTTPDVRRNTDDIIGRTTPIEPAAYPSEMIETTEQRAVELQGSLSETRNTDLKEQFDRYVADLLENSTHSRNKLEEAEFGSFAVVSAALDYNYDTKLHILRRLMDVHEADITDEQDAKARELLEAITMFGVIRGFVKDLYIQWELVKLSRELLYSAVFALTVAGGMAIFIDPATFPGTILGIERILWVVSGAFAVSTLPFLLFTAYILRLGTIAKLTLTMGPLRLR
jgi:hypothetical protein